MGLFNTWEPWFSLQTKLSWCNLVFNVSIAQLTDEIKMVWGENSADSGIFPRNICLSSEKHISAVWFVDCRQIGNICCVSANFCKFFE